ncbi:MAG: 2-oxoacid:acceptor oxidoreductase family protein [Deferribacteraceae bacterium]|nr:2-oxoacid:acceptor oxidoreductase family protein [Deferribacteraceae bacterium]
MKREIRLSGSGGQGLITAGIILAQAAVLDDKNAVQTQSYGPEARGGAAKAEVIISDEEIYYPKVTSPDILIALTQEAANKYISDMGEGGLVIADNILVESVPTGNYKVFKAPILSIASDILGSVLSANIVTLALLNALRPTVSAASLEKAVANAFPKKAELNMRALSEGTKLALV